MEREMALNFLRRLRGVNPLGGGVQGPLVGGAGGAMGLGTPGLGGGPSPGGLGGGMMPALGGPLAGATGFGGPGRTGVLLSPAELAGAMRGIRWAGPAPPPPRRNGGEPATRSARPRQIALTPRAGGWRRTARTSRPRSGQHGLPGLLWPSWRTQAGTGTDQWRPLEGGPLAEGCKIPLP